MLKVDGSMAYEGRPRMSRIVSVNPFRCRMWSDHDRLEEHISDESCRDELESFRTRGQLIPVLGRKVLGNSDYDVELVYGARRLFVARQLNVSLQVDLQDISDTEAILALDIENRQRKDVSPYERGLSYARWIQCGYFKSQEELARALGISASQVSRLLKLTKLPAVVLGAFRNPLEVRERWAADLYDVCQDSELRQSLSAKARVLTKRAPRLDAIHAYRALRSSIRIARTKGTGERDEVIVGENGRPLFRVKFRRKTVELAFDSATISDQSLRQIKAAIKGLLQAKQLSAGAPANEGRENASYRHVDPIRLGTLGSVRNSDPG